MTKRITISLPDDVAAYVEQGGGNSSGFIADVLRRRMDADDLRAQWAAAGYLVTDADVARARARLAGLLPITDDQHQRNLEWLTTFDHDHPTAA